MPVSSSASSFPGKFNLDESDILTVTYYDSYWYPGVKTFNTSLNISDYSDGTGNSYYVDDVKGQVTGTRTKVLDDSSVRWIVATNYYDNRYRVIQGLRDLYATDATYSEIVSSQYDFTGRALRTKINQSFGSTSITVDKYFTYDSQGRLTKTEQEIDGDANGRVTVAENVYNETGQLIDKKLHKAGSYDYLQNVDYAYNIRGWLTSINDPDNLSSDLFAERLLYNTSEYGLNSSYDPQYNGNISGMVWNSTQKSKQGYGFNYDRLNRLTLGDYKYYSGAWYDHPKYEENSILYDKNGNITQLFRTDQYGNNSPFYYSYLGNQLNNINSGPSYYYDQNGNTTYDGLRGMSIGYNVLNLPNSITKGSESISYIYSATGEKLAKRMKDHSYQYYAGNMVYNSDKTLKYILFEEGLVNKSSGAYTYEYHLKDHLGNTRVAFQPNGGSTTTTQVAEYYPFGSSYLPFNPAGSNKYLYNGKEKQDDVLSGSALDEYDYGARFYDPRIGRWHSVDPLAEKSRKWSPYAYCYSNSMRFIDSDGMSAGNYYGEDGELLGSDGVDDNKVYTADAVNKDSNGNVTSAENAKEVKNLTITELNTRAFMSTITEFEGGGYNIKFGGGTFEGNDHPGAVFDKKGTPHSAAGAYQIVERTAKNLMKEDQSITNFSPVNQDKMAVRIMKDSQNALNDVKGGNLNSAVAKLTGKTGLGIQWEALPGGNSKSKSMDQLRNSFKKNISNELNNKSKLATPQGELKTY